MKIRIVYKLTLLDALQDLLGLLVLDQWVGERHESTDGAVNGHLVILSDSDLGLIRLVQSLGGDLLLYRIDKSGLVLLVLLLLLGLLHTVLLGALLLLLSALFLLLDLVLAHCVGFKRKLSGKFGEKGWWVCAKKKSKWK